MNWLALIKALLAALASLVLWLRDRRALDAAEAGLVAANLRGALDAIGKAQGARDSVRRDIERHPDRLRDDDGFQRPD